ncbi:WD G-beta repeat-containing protein [Babesia ovata]|uniref:WD G-beta repeat-containing protein n=1 Tax=Babesia ovata TaxID=189622 RepID=A0A2H6KCU6_9APIC|nr:WD G-beta repeat-containing protein [Babesia ovata]GBE60812.1 WD G-beta repeat-containing protein [Babesia ovata]
MDVSSLSCSVQRTSRCLFTYNLHMKYMQAEWNIDKSFSDFEQLQESLVFQEFTDVPLLPDLQLSGGIDPMGDAYNSEEVLQKFIQEVLRRPDTRSCMDVLIFCDLLRHLQTPPTQVFATRLTSTPACHLSVSDLVYLENEKILIVAYEEKTALSKIGRMWSIIEPDILGAIRVFKMGANITDGATQIAEHLFHSKIRAIKYVRESATLVVAKDDGYVGMYRMENDWTEFESIGSIALHSGPIVSFDMVKHLGFTSGYDDTIRCFDATLPKTVSGGKLTKRLNGDKLLASAAASPRTMFIGTSNNQIYTYYMMDDVPVFVDCCEVPAPMNIRKIHCTPSNLFVAHGNCVSCYRYSRSPVETIRELKRPKGSASAPVAREMTGIGHQKEPAPTAPAESQPYNGTISFPMSIRSAQFSVNSSTSSFSTYQVYDIALRPQAKQLLVAYDEVVAIWCVAKGVMLYSWYAHRHAQVHVLRVLEPEGLVVTGGSDGEVRVWRLPDPSLLMLGKAVSS